MNTFTISGMVRYSNFRQTTGRQAVAWLSVAAETAGHNAQFVDVTLFRENAHKVKDVPRGTVVEVTGYIGKTKRIKDGKECYEMQLIADDVRFVDQQTVFGTEI